MANISQLPSGKWRVLIRRAGLPAMSRSFSTERLAIEWAGSTDKQITDGVLQQKLTAISLDSKVPTFEVALDAYVKTESVKKKGYRQEADRASRLAKTFLGPMKLTEIDSSVIAKYRDMRTDAGLGGNTVRLELALISVLFSHHVERKDVPGLLINPVRAVKKPKLPPGRDRRLVGDEEERIFKAAFEYANPEMPTIILMAIEVGPRLSEILKLTWDEIDFKRGVAFLGDTKDPTGRGRNREVPLSDVILEALSVLLELRKDGDPKPFHYTDDGFRTCWYEILSRAGIEHTSLHFHDLRHELTSRLFERDNLNIMEAATITGHKDPRMLMRYTHLKAADIRKKMNRPAVEPAKAAERASVDLPLAERVQSLNAMYAAGMLPADVYKTKLTELMALL